MIISKFELPGKYLEELLNNMNSSVLGGFEMENINVKLMPSIRKIGFNPLKIQNLTQELDGFDIVHLVSGYQRLKLIMGLKLLGKKVVNHWVGTDVLDVTEKKYDCMLAHLTDKLIDMQVANSSHLVDELKSAGITTRYLPIIPLIPEKVKLDYKKGVLIYIPSDRIKFHRGYELLELAKLFPDISFEVIDSNGQGLPNLSNIHYNGWVDDMEIIWQKVSVLLRFPKHDGLPSNVLEALAHEKWVIWNYPFPCCSCIESIDEISGEIAKLLNKNTSNTEGRKFILSEFNYDVISKKYLEIYNNI